MAEFVQEDFDNFWSECPWEEDLKYANAVCEEVSYIYCLSLFILSYKLSYVNSLEFTESRPVSVDHFYFIAHYSTC